jgi:hypothetical protein
MTRVGHSPASQRGAVTTGLRSDKRACERRSDEGRSRKRRGNGEAGGAPEASGDKI